MYSKLDQYIKNIEKDIADISVSRKEKLDRISDYIRLAGKAGNEANLTFICTHNSRRSHLCQIWAATAVHYYGYEHVRTFSGGTEATAFNPRAVAAVKRAGFRVEEPGGESPRYKVWFDEDREPMTCFSKTFDDPYNPQENFAAIMTCSDADRNCPNVPGASFRASIPYVDPKEADDTPDEAQTYDERCRQIATEMFYLMFGV